MTDWENDYIAIRKKEGFLFTDDEVKTLPLRPKNDINYSKWRLRQKSTHRLLSYLSDRISKDADLLDLGCGNGWFSSKVAAVKPDALVEAWDVNHTELDQAKRVFQLKNLSFQYQDVFDENIVKRFDVIILNSVIQYFPDLTLLLERLFKLLKPFGELHIVDSPFYETMNIKSARNRTVEYYKSIGFPQMSAHYFHHDIKLLESWKFTVMYQPNNWLKRVKRKLGAGDSPFMWIKIFDQM